MAQATHSELLTEIRRHVPSATQEQLDKELTDASLTTEKVLSSNALIGSIVGRLKKNIPGEMIAGVSSVPTTIVDPTSAPKEQPKTTTGKSDRDWSIFKIKDLPTLTTEQLKSFRAYRQAELDRLNLMNEILGLESESLDVEALTLQAQAKVLTASRSVEGDRHAFELSSGHDDELLKLAREAAKVTTLDQLTRDRTALEGIVELGKQTPTYGELRQLQAQQFQRDRMNRSIGIQNSTATKAQLRQLAGSDPDVVTIDA